MWDDQYDPAPGAGGPLVGTVYPLIIWVSAAGRPWTAAEKSAVRQAARDAREWIATEAINNGVSLRFLDGGEFGASRDLTVTEIPLACGSGEELTTWMPLLTRMLGYESPGQLLVSIQNASGCDGLHALVMVRGAGRSYAVSAPGDPSEADVIPVAACYLGNDGSISRQTIAHEILHLHGAWDLYEDAPRLGSRHNASTVHFPNDIMFRVDPPLEALEIGPLTRWRIGWDSKAADWYDFYRPSDRGHQAAPWETASPPPVHRSGASGSLHVATHREPPRAEPERATRSAHRDEERVKPRPKSGPFRAHGRPPATERTPAGPPPRIPGTRQEELAPAGAQAGAYRELFAIAKRLIDAHGVGPRAPWADFVVPEPRFPRTAGRFRSQSPEVARLWTAFDTVRVEQESVRAAIGKLRGAGIPLEMRIRDGFQSWKAAIHTLSDLSKSTRGAHAIAEAEGAARTWQRRVAEMVDTLSKRATTAENANLVQAAGRFLAAWHAYDAMRRKP
jgi:hypothetical protein